MAAFVFPFVFHSCDACSLDIHVRDLGHATDINVDPTFDRSAIAHKT